MKYIRHDLFGFIVFPSALKHSDVATNLGWRENEILSAGFVYLHDGLLVCRGQSISLNKANLLEDSALINKQMQDTRYDL